MTTTPLTGVQLARMLGLPDETMKAVITLEPYSVAVVEATLVVGIDNGELETALKRYELVEREEVPA